MNIGILGQVRKCGEGDPVVLGIFGYIVFINEDEGHQVFSAVADHHGVLNVGAEFQFVFHVGRCDILSPRGDEDVFFAVKDFQRAILHDPHVPGIKPSVPDGFCGELGFLMIPFENPRTLDQDLSVLGDLHLKTGDRLTHISQPGVVRPGDSDDAGGFGLAVSFHQGNSQPVKKLKQFRSGRGRTAEGPANLL